MGREEKYEGNGSKLSTQRIQRGKGSKLGGRQKEKLEKRGGNGDQPL